uniref:R3H domain-containing protein n=1 Tax=Seriola lalandi dorsalis TaxID=1841481 RepID=A0A3B4X4S1_SERLL
MLPASVCVFQAKGKLVRSMAICEESSPFEEIQVTHTHTHRHTHTLSSTSSPSSSSHSNYSLFSSLSLSFSLSLSLSVEYTDSTGIDLHQFIVDTLNSNPRDRMMLLKLEQDMIDFITSNSPFKKFPHMSSYHRMLVHRVAAYFGMEHNVDQTGKSVIINRTKSTRIPEQRFLDEVHKDKAEEIHCWKIILKRDSSSDDQTRLHPLREKQSKSMEEREEEYQRARERIFNQEVRRGDRGRQTGRHDIETERRLTNFSAVLLQIILDVSHRGSRDSSGSSWTGSSRQSSTETDCRYSNDPRPWSSTDSDSSYQWTGPAPKPRQPPNHSWEARGAGQPFLNPDGSPAVYNPPDSQQPIRSQTQLQGSPSQQQQQQVAQTHTQQEVSGMRDLVTVPYIHVAIEDLSSQFAHVTVNCQSAGEAPPLGPPSQGYIYAAPPPPPPPPNPTSYCQPSPQVGKHTRN